MNQINIDERYFCHNRKPFLFAGNLKNRGCKSEQEEIADLGNRLRLDDKH